MAYESGSLDATLAAATGQDIGVLAELRTALVESADKQLDLLKRSRCDGNWDRAVVTTKIFVERGKIDVLLVDNYKWEIPGHTGCVRNSMLCA